MGNPAGDSFPISKSCRKDFFGNKLYILREHREEAALEKLGCHLWMMLVRLQRFRQICQYLSHFASDFSRILGAIQRVGIAPDPAEEIAGFLLVQVFQRDAVGARIGETLILPAGAGELGVKIEGVPDIADDEKRRSPLLRWERVDVSLALCVGALEGFVEGGGAAFPVTGGNHDGFSEIREERLVGIGLVAVRVHALLGFKDEVAGFVEVDPVGSAAAVRFFPINPALEGVGVPLVIG